MRTLDQIKTLTLAEVELYARRGLILRASVSRTGRMQWHG